MITACQAWCHPHDAGEDRPDTSGTRGEWHRRVFADSTLSAVGRAAPLWPRKFIVGLAALLCFAFVSTAAPLDVEGPGGMPTGKTVTAEQLWQEFDRTLPPDVWVSPLQNKHYEVISAKWMRRTFLPALKQQMKDLWAHGVPETDSAGNCNGFALVCRLMLSLSAMSVHARAPATATVIVSQERPFGGLSATMENHSVAYVLTDEGPWIIEAQSGEYTPIAQYPNLKTIKLVSVH